MKARWMIAAGLLAACGAARADETVWLSGRVLTANGKRPLHDAIVAVFDDKARVVDYAKTDADGNYSLAVPKAALHLFGKGGGGFLHEVTGGVGRLIGGVAGPVKTGLRAAAGAVPVGDPISKTALGAATGIAQNIVDVVAPGKKGSRPGAPPAGSLIMKVSLPGHNDAVSLAHVYWMQREVYRTGGREQKALTAWLDPVSLTDAGAEKPSTIASDYLSFTDVRLEPSIAELGQRVSLTARMPAPPEPRTPAVVVARSSRTGKMYELTPVGDGIYRTEIEIDKNFPKHDQVFSVLAYAEQPEAPGRSKRVEDGLVKTGLFDPKKPYVYDPLLVVSRNRGEVTLTVVDPVRKRR